ncbi:hypothetical protein [Smaragdicoccus niigatensis]|uniref:hypothetical protein n=1 Tax=Smaragdicoccus niigatensis TaxID=359359 RepID=UPI00036E4593|nr:hypothetical protein [Smaragdicoccus niigatensis]
MWAGIAFAAAVVVAITATRVKIARDRARRSQAGLTGTDLDPPSRTAWLLAFIFPGMFGIGSSIASVHAAVDHHTGNALFFGSVGALCIYGIFRIWQKRGRYSWADLSEAWKPDGGG